MVVALLAGTGSSGVDSNGVVTPGPAELSESESTVPGGVIVFDTNRSGNFEVYSMEADGSEVRALTSDPGWDSWWPRVAPDRRHILFYRTPAGVHDRDYSKTRLWVMNADGSGPVLLRPPGQDGWDFQGHAEWSPDGSELVMFGGSRQQPQIHVTTATGRHLRQVTERKGVSLDPSWSPDGRSIVFVGCPRAVCGPRDYEVYTVDAVSVQAGEAQRVTDDDLRDQDPYFSPDGHSLAWLTQTSTSGTPVGTWNIRVADPDGSGLRRLTNDDGKVNSKPEWSRDGSLIYFHRMDFPRSMRFSVWVIRPDGTGRHEVTSGQPGVNEFPST